MATGDAAAAAGLAVFPATQDARLGYENDNKRGDELAAHMTTGGHRWSRISEKPTKFPTSTELVEGLPIIATADAARANAVPVYNGTGQLTTSDPTLGGHAASKQYVDRQAEAAANLGINAAAGRALAFNGDGNAVRSAQGPTGSAYGRNAGNGRFAVWMDDSLQFGRSVSSARYKDDIEPHDIDPAAVLALRPVTYHYKSDPPGVREFGLIAEDTYDAGVPEVVTWFNDQIDGIRYELLSVALLSVVRDLDARVNELQARLDAQTPPKEA